MVHIPPRLRFSVFFVYFVFFVVPLPYFVVPFVCIRGSYTAPTTGFCLFRVFRVFRGSTPVFRGSIRGSIRVHSCPFVVHTLPPSLFFVPFVFFVVPFVYLTFVSIRVHSWFLLSPLLSFFVPFVPFVVPLLYFVVPFVVLFVSIRGSYSPPLPSFFVYFVYFVVPLLSFVVPFVVQSSGVGVFLSYRRWASPLRCQVILTECGRRRAAAPIISGRKVQTPQGRKPG